MAARMLHGACAGGKAAARNLVFFCVKWRRQAMEATSCVRWVRAGFGQGSECSLPRVIACSFASQLDAVLELVAAKRIVIVDFLNSGVGDFLLKFVLKNASKSSFFALASSCNF